MFLKLNGAYPHTANTILDILHHEFGNCVLLNQFPEGFGCGQSWPPWSPEMNPSWDHVYCTNLYTVHKLQGETKAVEDHSNMLHDTANNSVVHLQQVHKVKGSHIEHVFTWRPHAHKLSMKVSFHSCIICFCTLENYTYTVPQNCCVFFWIPSILSYKEVHMKCNNLYGSVPSSTLKITSALYQYNPFCCN